MCASSASRNTLAEVVLLPGETANQRASQSTRGVTAIGGLVVIDSVVGIGCVVAIGREPPPFAARSILLDVVEIEHVPGLHPPRLAQIVR